MKLAEVPLLSGAEPIFGHARQLRSGRLPLLARAAREQPDACRLRAFGQELLLAHSPALMHDVFVEKAKYFEKTPQLRILLYLLGGRGLFTSEGDLWKRQRRLMAPLFGPGAVLQYVRVVTDVVERAAERFAPGSIVDVGREMTRITMGIVGKALFDADAFDEADELGDALTVALDWFNNQVGSPGLAVQLRIHGALERGEGRVPRRLEPARAALLKAMSSPILLFGAYGRRHREAIARLDRKIQAMIDERRASKNPPDDLLTRLLRARDEDGSRMDDRQVRDEAVTLFVAGHETTATALTWAIYELARAPELRKELTREADRIRSFDDFRQPGRMTYAIKVFKEAMRLYPPVYVVTRRAREPIRVGAYELDKGAIVFASTYALHRRPDLYPDPERFDPERFAPDVEAARPRAAYAPFGAGPRTCIGNHFALMEGPIVLLALARALTLDVVSGHAEPASFTTLRPAAPIMAAVRARGNAKAAAE